MADPALPPLTPPRPPRRKGGPSFSDYFRYEGIALLRAARDAKDSLKEHVVANTLAALALFVAGGATGYELWGTKVSFWVGALVIMLAGVGLLFLLYLALAPARIYFEQRGFMDAKDEHIASLGATLFSQLGADEPKTPPSLRFETIAHHTDYLPAIKVYHFSLLDSGGSPTFRALCDGWLNGPVKISVTSQRAEGRESVNVEPSRQGENTFTFTLPESRGSEARIAIGFQTIGQLRIRDIEELPPNELS
jgi:hypothetical protein